MTEKDAEIQDLRREVRRLRESLNEFVKLYRCCRLCKYIDADCSPTGNECRPEWGGNI